MVTFPVYSIKTTLEFFGRSSDPGKGAEQLVFVISTLVEGGARITATMQVLLTPSQMEFENVEFNSSKYSGYVLDSR